MGSRTIMAGASQWWLQGYINPVNCVAAYQPIGASSLAASYTNLANPGTYDARNGVAPGWDVTNGWKPTGSEYLVTGLQPPDNQISWSIFMRYSNKLNTGHLTFGYLDPTFQYGVFLAPDAGDVGNGQYNSMTCPSSGIVGFVGAQPYLNGFATGPTITPNSVTAWPFFIGAVNVSGSPISFSQTYIQAIAIYSTVLSSQAALAVCTAMDAL